MNTDVVEKYFALREVNGLSKEWLDKLRSWINHYLRFVDYEISEDNTLDYFKTLMHLERLFSTAPIRIKDSRKFFSQEWDRRGGPTSVKKIRGTALDMMLTLCIITVNLRRI